MFSAGELIWASCRPLIRLVLCVACGFIITKTDNFPPVAARGAGQVMLNIALPCLMFSKIVPAFTADNINALGPLVLVALLYEAIGLLMAWVIKQFFWVPHRFRYGVLVAGGWGNVGDIPTSVIVSVTGAAPFNGTIDQNLSVAYISAFILVFMLTLFPGGGNRLIALDYVGPDVEPEQVQEAVRRRRRAIIYAIPNAISRVTRRRHSSIPKGEVDEASISDIDEKQPAVRGAQEQRSGPVRENSSESMGITTAMAASVGRHVSFNDHAISPPTDGIRSPIYSPTPTEIGFGPSVINSPEPTVVGVDAPRYMKKPEGHELLPTTRPPSLSGLAAPADSSATTNPTIFGAVLRFLRSLFSLLLAPASLSILLSFPIALIPPLKGLFVTLPPSNSTSTFSNPHIHPAPDGLPPLSIILDTATFIGGASVPLGLICLGAALARLNVPRNQWRTLPTGAIASLAIGKMLIAPVMGVGIVRALVNGGIISKEDKVLQFVCIGTGSAEHLPPFLIPQYILMFISMTALTAYTLQYLF
ncbi:hypothetical protein DXG01_008025 [Tephrocybe rancida]|nr:hypothetical protein DXG01_008025 [Tephrocybe rancida]